MSSHRPPPFLVLPGLMLQHPQLVPSSSLHLYDLVHALPSYHCLVCPVRRQADARIVRSKLEPSPLYSWLAVPSQGTPLSTNKELGAPKSSQTKQIQQARRVKTRTGTRGTEGEMGYSDKQPTGARNQNDNQPQNEPPTKRGTPKETPRRKIEIGIAVTL